jgi:hypothetical protein
MRLFSFLRSVIASEQALRSSAAMRGNPPADCQTHFFCLFSLHFEKLSLIRVDCRAAADGSQ